MIRHLGEWCVKCYTQKGCAKSEGYKRVFCFFCLKESSRVYSYRFLFV